MKYIRTKEGIYELDNDWALFCKEYANNKQADTIEELCGVIVVLSQNGIHRLYDFNAFGYKTRLERMAFIALIREKYKDSIIYGAIWTDKGLIYVAKMNESGDLELL